MNPELAAKAIAAGRVVFGVAFIAAPGFLGERWAGKVARKPGAQIFIRALGARDLALGAGLLASRREDLRTWVLAGVLADATDFGASLAARDHLDQSQLAATLAVAGGTAAAGVALAAALGSGS